MCSNSVVTLKRRAWSRSQNVQHFGEINDNLRAYISRTKGLTFENSADLEWGAAPRSKSAEFSKVRPLVREILHSRRLSAIFGCYTFWDPDPTLDELHQFIG